MVRWFDPQVLFDAAKRAIVSATFGTYADRRLIRAALTPGYKEIDVEKEINVDKGEGVWVDYVADLGDGFDSTYTVAYLLAKDKLEINNKQLPRGNVLIMGGDEVYPTPTRDEYKRRLERPYELAFPKDKDNDSRPFLFMLPGNHDWYDGLTLFLAKYCKGKNTKKDENNEKDKDNKKDENNESNTFSNWRLSQRRSYFAVRIPNKWWIWGIDTQLTDDLDEPQANYFKEIAYKMKMEPDSKIILCSSVPTWITADYKEPKLRKAFKRGINCIATEILKKICPTAKIYAVISGDLHHYSRYTNADSNVHFITAGGGGAFLHPTHHLKDKIYNITWQKNTTPLMLAKKNGSNDTNDKACFPDRKTSKSLATRNLLFPLKNINFIWILSVFYALMSIITMQSLTMNNSFSETIKQLGFSPITWCTFLALTVILFKYADYHKKTCKFFASFIHALIHILALLCLLGAYNSMFYQSGHNWSFNSCCFIIVSLMAGVVVGLILKYYFKLSSEGVSLFAYVFAWLFLLGTYDLLFSPYGYDWSSNSWCFTFLIIILGVSGGLIGGFLWGIYLWISSRYFSAHYNDAFSAMSIPDYKNFLRMHIEENKLTIYPIGIKRTPKRKDWNPTMQTQGAAILPKEEIKYEFIEEPIIIST